MKNSIQRICNKLEKLIQWDPIQRGIEYLHIPGQLHLATSSLNKSNHVIIATGFPCCMTAPWTESDGPPGSVILADSLLKHDSNRKVTMMIDPVHSETIEPLINYYNENVKLNNKNNLELYVCADDMNFGTNFMENKQFKDVDVMIAVELVGVTSDGRFMTMNARDISDLCGNTALLFDYIGKNSDKNNIITIGIGDGGNECGMGNAVDNVRNYIEYGDQIACVIKANYLITAGVSNWGAEAMAVALGTFCNDELHRDIYLKTSEFGIMDGDNGKGDGWADSLPYEQHGKMYKALCDTYTNHSLIP